MAENAAQFKDHRFKCKHNRSTASGTTAAQAISKHRLWNFMVGLASPVCF
jgi:hypothetical protein